MKTNKRFLFLSLIALAGLLACNFGGVISNVEEEIGEFVRGSGIVVEEDRPVDGFNAIDMAGVGQVIVEFGSEEALRIEAEDNIIGFIETQVRGRTLVIGIEEDVNIIPTETIRIFVTAVSLDSVTVSGAGDIQLPEHETSDFEIILTGLGNFVLEELIADRLVVEIDGSGNVEINGGEVTEQTVTIGGLGNYEGGDLESQIVSVEITGAGNATVWATESLNVDLSGIGNISYYGSPELELDRSGLGDINPLGNK